MVPSFIIILLFLAAFVLATWQYCQIDPRRRILNLRFLLMAGGMAGVIGYPIYVFQSPDDLLTSWLMLGLGLLWVGTAYWLLKRMPPRDEY